MQTNLNIYDDGFLRNIAIGSESQAKIIVPLLIEKYNPKSVIDIGCSYGIFLSQFPQDVYVYGLDCCYQALDIAVIDKEKIHICDLTEPVELEKKYDLCICIEVAEHIQQDGDDVFMDTVCKSSDLVIWTAAPKGQNGHGHINEQSFEYWLDKFKERGFYFDRDDTRYFKDMLTPDERIFNWIKWNFMVYKKNV